MTFNYTPTSNGGLAVEGSSFVSYQAIDDFEDNDMDEYFFPAGTGSATPTTAAAMEGTYGLAIEGVTEPRSMPSYSPSLPNYPGPGDHIQFKVRFNTLSTDAQHRFTFCKQTDDTTNEYEFQFYESGAFRIMRDDSGTKTELQPIGTVSLQTSTVYVMDVWFQTADNTGDFRIRCMEEDTGTVLDDVDGIDDTSTVFGSGGISYFSNDFADWDLDAVRIIP